VKAETSDKEAADSTPPSGAVTPSLREVESSESSSAADEDDQTTLRSAAPSEAQSGDTTVQAGSSTASRQVSSTDPKKSDTNPSSSPSPESPTTESKMESKNLLGKINNLVTTDMQVSVNFWS
jgi:hypothetical protein